MNFDTTLRNIVYFGAFLVLFIPFIVSNDMFFPFITGKNFTFRVIAEIMFFSWLILAFRNPVYRPTFSWIAASVTAFIAVIALANLQGVNPEKSFWSNFERMEGFVTLLHMFGYFLAISLTLRTQQAWTWFWNTSVGASVLMAFFGLYQLGGFAVINQGGVRVDGKFGNATYLAIYMLFHVFITAILLFRWRGGNYMRYLYGIAIILQVSMIYFAATRGTILGLLGGAFVTGALMLYFERERKKLRNVAIGILITLLVVVGGFFLVKDASFIQDSPVLKRFANISVDSGTVQARFTIWAMAWEGIKERPVLGWGQENFNLVFNQQYNPVLFADEPWFDRVHNILFDWTIAGGFLGLIAYLLIPIAVLYYIWFGRGDQLSNVDKSLLTGVLAGYMFHNLFVFDNLISYMYYFSILAYVYAMTRPAVDESSVIGRHLDTGTLRVVTPVAIVLLVFTIYFFNTKGILASTTLIDALRQNNVPAAVETFQEALAYDSKIANQEIREQIMQAAVRAAQSRVPIEQQQEIFNLSVSEMEKQIEQAPEDARHYLFLGSLLETFGQHAQAEGYFLNAQKYSPNKQTIRFSVAGNLWAQQRFDEAIPLLKETAELEPDFPEAQIMYATSLIYVGRQEEADAILETQPESKVVNNARLLQAYFNTNQIEEVRDIWIARVEERPGNRNYRIQLAAAYLELEQRDEAVAQIEEIISRDPSFAAQGAQLIEEIRAGNNP